MTSWWLSFVDEALPKGQRFLGASIVEEAETSLAIIKSHRLGCNPGGEVLVAPLDDDFASLIPERFKNRLLSKTEIKEFDKTMDAKRAST